MADPLPGLGRDYKCRFKQFLGVFPSHENVNKVSMSEYIFILDSNSHGNVGVVPRTAPRAPTVKAPDFEKPLRGDKPNGN